LYQEARAIVFNHSLWFDTPIWWGDSFATTNHGLGLSLLYAPSIALWSRLAAFSPAIPAPGVYSLALLYSDPLYTMAVAPINAIVTAITAYGVARLVRMLGLGNHAAVWRMLLFGIASPAIVYARKDFDQPLEALYWTFAVLMALFYYRS